MACNQVGNDQIEGDKDKDRRERHEQEKDDARVRPTEAPFVQRRETERERGYDQGDAPEYIDDDAGDNSRRRVGNPAPPQPVAKWRE